MLLTMCVVVHLTFDVISRFCVEPQQWDHRGRGRDGALCVGSLGLRWGLSPSRADCQRQCFLRSMSDVQGRDYAPLPWPKLFSSSSTNRRKSRSPGWYLKGRSGRRSRSSEGGVGLEGAVLSIHSFDEDEEEAGLGFERTAFAEKGDCEQSTEMSHLRKSRALDGAADEVLMTSTCVHGRRLVFELAAFA